MIEHLEEPPAVVTDPHAETAPPQSASPIENEIPTYRAISTWAVASVVLGVISSMTFASLSFLIAAVGAVAAGAIALRMVRAYPDLLTGKGLANLGIALGLICGLGASTFKAVQWMMIGTQSTRFAEVFSETLTEEGVAEAFWLQAPPEVRAGQTPQEILSQAEEAAAGEPGAMSSPRYLAVKQLHERFGSSDEHHIHVDTVERRGFDGTTPFAEVRVRLEGPAAEGTPAEEFALLRIKGTPGGIGARRDWWVEEIRYPYEAGASGRVVESAHGHEH